MLPALPVEATSAREADMAGARRGAQPAEKAPAGTARGTRPQAAKPPAAKGPAAKGPATRARKPGAKRAPAKPGPPAEPVDEGNTVKPDAEPRAKAAELPVREGEHQWTSAELAEVRSALREQIEGLRAEIAASANQIAEGDTSDGAGDDQADAGAKTYEREHELALSYNSQDLLAQIERAVQRMDAGTYGTCESCAKPIGKARLQVFPRATLCVTCKQREERR
ncbi:TraR/DksA family transcriptional regulator [Actinomadura syzygii]|uniref:TraR/DksA family transcriptional regulator n=1 Tax=Actinomadura syzygii TaxID=1427538 RepID=A0A5D0TZ05_9ACTN|nr:TraR/DksA family transcriptional regulator [Actinomadura syzygii]